LYHDVPQRKKGPNVPSALEMRRCRFKSEILAVQSRHMGSVDIPRARGHRHADVMHVAVLPFRRMHIHRNRPFQKQCPVVK
jgi:hypothetical protein